MSDITFIHKNADSFADLLAESLKGAIKTYNCSNCLKLAYFTLLHKKGRKDNQNKYRLVSILPILEGIHFDQMSVYFIKLLSDQQCRFRKGHSTEHCLLILLEKWRVLLIKVNRFELYYQTSKRYLIASTMNY